MSSHCSVSDVFTCLGCNISCCIQAGRGILGKKNENRVQWFSWLKHISVDEPRVSLQDVIEA